MIIITAEKYRGLASDAECFFPSVADAEKTLSEIFEHPIHLRYEEFRELGGFESRIASLQWAQRNGYTHCAMVGEDEEYQVFRSQADADAWFVAMLPNAEASRVPHKTPNTIADEIAAVEEQTKG